MSEDDAVATDDVYVEARLTFTDGGTIRMRQVLFGLAPAILIEPDVDEDVGRYGFIVNSVDLEPDELVTVLRLCADNIERADEIEEEGSDG